MSMLYFNTVKDKIEKRKIEKNEIPSLYIVIDK